jgi:tellurite resistance protein TerC
MVAPPFPLWAWLVFVGLVLALLFLDLFVFHRNAREVPFGEAMWLSGFWIAISLAFGGFVWFLAGADGAAAYVTAYLLEKSLSLDNVFVFSVIFTSFAVPPALQVVLHADGYDVLLTPNARCAPLSRCTRRNRARS